MKSAVEQLSPTKVKLTAEVPADEFAPILRAAYAQAAQEVQVPGFRKGKVPRRIIDQRLGQGAVTQFAIDQSLDRWYEQAVADNKIVPLAPPSAEVVSRPDADNPDVGVVFTAEVEIRPDVELPDLASLTVTVPTAEVTESDIDQQIEELRERFGTLTGVDRAAAEGDFVSIDLTAAVGDEEIDSVAGISYQVGSKTMLEGLDEALVGLSAGETATFTSDIASGAHAGEDGLVTATVRSVKERELPALDDEFVQVASEFDTVEELREGVAEVVANVKRNVQYFSARRALLDALVEATQVPVPEGVLARVVARRLERQPEAGEREEIETEVAASVRLDLTQDLLAASLNTEVTQEDLVEYLVQAASRAQMDPSDFVEQAQESGAIHQYVADIGRRKALDSALSQVVVVDDDGNPVDLAAILARLGEQNEQSGDDEDIEIVDEE
ncbi:MAG: trigger factor [Bifidobacteriaceae bacterium]|nr:trigger factor [Bifidobacteriaceae bacterium]